MALQQVRFEIAHMGGIINDMFARLKAAMENGDREGCNSVVEMDDQVDILHDAILNYLSDIRQVSLTDSQSHEFQSLMSSTINLENLADVIESELADIGKQMLDLGDRPSENARMLLGGLADKVQQSIADIVRAVGERDEKAGENVITAKDEVRRLSDEFLSHQSQRIGIQTETHLNLVRLELELLDKLRRIYTLSKRIAKDQVPKEVARRA